MVMHPGEADGGAGAGDGESSADHLHEQALAEPLLTPPTPALAPPPHITVEPTPSSAPLQRQARVVGDESGGGDTDGFGGGVGNRRRPFRSIDEFYEEAYQYRRYEHEESRRSVNDDDGGGSGCGEYFAFADCGWMERWRVRFWFIFFSMGVANVGESAVLYTSGYILSDVEFQADILHHDLARDGAIIASMALTGMIVGGLVTGAFEDTLGRKPTLLLGLFVNFSACFLGAFSPNVAALATLYFLMGLGIGAIVSSVTALSTELSPPSERGFLVTFVSSFWAIGSLFIAAVGLVVLGTLHMSWRVFMAACSLPSLLGFVLVWCVVPDSARFLALHGRYEEAAWCANEVARSMRYRGPKLEVEEVVRSVHHPDEAGYWALSSSPCLEEQGSGASAGTAATATACIARAQRSAREAAENVSKLYSMGLRKVTVYLQLLWIFLELGSGLGLWINTIFRETNADVYVDAFLVAVAGIGGNAMGAILLDTVGRKWVLTWCLVLGSVSLASFAAVVDDFRHHSTRVVLSVCVYSALLACAWSTITVMTGEMFPTKVRSTGMGWCAACGRSANIVVQFVNGALVDRPAVLLSLASAIVMVGALIAPTLRVSDMSLQPLSDDVFAHDRNAETTSPNQLPGEEGPSRDDLFLEDQSSVVPQSPLV